MLQVHNLNANYGGIRALHDVSVEVKKGESVLLVGSNGAGKSTLINTIIGLVSARSGEIHFDGQDISHVACADRGRMGIGYSPEGRRIFSSLTVSENVMAGSFGISAREAKSNFEWILQNFPIIAERRNQRANLMSGGEQQVVAIARAAVTMPKLLLLDEPFLGLAPIWISRVSDVIRKLQARGTTILMTEQMAKPALKLVKRAYVLRGGEIRRAGSVDEIRQEALAEEYL
jgi:branched-chain amino acid transport system ATP-binding protein